MYTKGLFRVLIPCCDRGLFHKVDKQISVKRNFSLPQTFSVGYCECKVHFFKNCSTEKLWEKLIEKNKTKHRMKWSVKKKYQQPRGEQFTEHKLNPASRENRLQKDHQKAGRCSIFDPWCKFTTGHMLRLQPWVVSSSTKSLACSAVITSMWLTWQQQHRQTRNN